MDHETAIRWVAALNQADSGHGYLLPSGPVEGFEWNFSFGNGFQGTNLVGNALYVVVYYPESSAGQPALNPPPSESLPHNE
jgi:hypothetical protein